MKKVLDYVQQKELIAKGDHVVVGVSGGADSVCLLFVLKEISAVLDFTISAVHVNHHLRGAEADRDEAFTKNLCERLEVPCEVYHYDVDKLANMWKMSTEEAGRVVRYEAFEKHCRFIENIDKNENSKDARKFELTADGTNVTGLWVSEVDKTNITGEWPPKEDKCHRCSIKIALAHHQNDVAETFLYHLARGTDLAGLSAIRPKRDSYIRPLLCMNRQEIEHYLKVRNIEYVTDSTNEEDIYTRNKLRHHVVAYLEREINPQTASHMAETSESLGEIWDYLQSVCQEKYKNYVEIIYKGADTGAISGAKHLNMISGIFIKEELALEHKTVGKNVIRMALEALSGSLKNIGRVHIESVYALFENQVGKGVSLPYSMRAEKEYKGIRITKYAAALEMKCKEPALQFPEETIEENREKSENASLNKDRKNPGADKCGEMSETGKSKVEIIPAVVLNIPGETVFENYRITTVFEKESHILEEIPQKTYTKWFDYDKIQGILVARYRKTGDYLVVNAAGGRKKLKDYFINEKIPQKERDEIPLVCCGDHVAWVCGHRISELYKVDDTSKRILKIQISAIHRK